MTFFRASQSDRDQFDEQGYILVRSLFSPQEASILQATARGDESLRARSTTRSDAKVLGATTLALDNELGDDLYARIVRSRRVADNMSVFLRDEVYHYHHKMMLKEPYVGGAWEWHQDYGYWYNFWLSLSHDG